MGRLCVLMQGAVSAEQTRRVASSKNGVLICIFIIVFTDSVMTGALQIRTGFVYDVDPNVYAEEMTSQLRNMNNTVFGNSTAVLHTTDIGINFTNGFVASTEVCQFAAGSGAHSVIVVINCTSSYYVTSVLEHMQIPTIIVEEKSCDIGGGTYQPFKSISPTATHLTVGPSHVINVLKALIVEQNSENIIIFYDNVNDGALLCDLVMTSLPTLNTTATVYEVGVTLTKREVNAILQAAKPAPDIFYPYLVFTSSNTTKYILNQAGLLQMRGRESRWILRGGSYNKHTIEPLLTTEDNIILIADGDAAAMLNKATVMMMEVLEATDKTFSDLTMSGMRPQDDATEGVSPKLPGCRSPISTTLRKQIARKLQQQMPQDTTYNGTYPEYSILSSVARLDHAPKLEKVGTWTSDQELDVAGTELFPNSFNGYNNRTFLVTSLEYSFFQKKIHRSDGSVKWVGLTFTVLDELAKDLNFSYEVIEPPDLLWGIEQEDGTWNGMIAQVINKSVDFAAACFSITAGREVVIDFAQPYFYDRSAVIIKRPQSENKLALYLKPFSWQVWACCVSAVVLYGTLLWLVTMASPYHYTNMATDEQQFGGHRLRNTILYFYGCLMQQGGIWLPRTHSGRILVGCFWFFTIVIVATYTGNLIATLAVNSINLPFNSLSEMVKQTQIQWGPAFGVAMVMLFREATFEPYTSVYRGMKPVNGYGEGLKRVKDGDYAFVAEKSWYQAEVAKDCNLAMIKETFYPTNYGWAFPTNAPIVKIINDRINKMRESGLLTHWTKQWTPQALNCTGLKPVTSAKTVDMVDFQGAVYVLGTGLFVGLILLTSEIVLVAAKRNRTRDGLPSTDGKRLSTPDGENFVTNNNAIHQPPVGSRSSNWYANVRTQSQIQFGVK